MTFAPMAFAYSMDFTISSNAFSFLPPSRPSGWPHANTRSSLYSSSMPLISDRYDASNRGMKHDSSDTPSTPSSFARRMKSSRVICFAGLRCWA